MLIKNSPSESISKLLFTRWGLDFIAVLFFLIRFQLKNAFAVIKAHIYVIQNLRNIQNKRNESLINKFGEIKISPSKFSLVWQYYIKGKKRYPELIPD